ncbi:hypothetical protein EDB95_3210 [Dinghuibacter silviterrae]|uniref:Uncharacterized protein n=2 Tax=Dinghuibacter silviterrae TaxID=1539049 RepID=A0A4R8DUT3_9BACT|nr:hypothetical protein EDB95_3210 [Dinghuibacter silviterrae]
MMLALFLLAGCNGNNADKTAEGNNKKEFYDLYNSTLTYYKLGESNAMLDYAKEMLLYAQSLNNDSFEVVSYKMVGNCYYLLNDHISAINYYFTGIQLCENRPALTHLLPELYNNIGFNYSKLGVQDKALEYLKKAEDIASKSEAKSINVYILENLAETYLSLERPIPALHYLDLATKLNEKFKDKYIQASICLDYGNAYYKLFLQNHSADELALSKYYFENAIAISDATRDFKHFSNSTLEYGNFFFKQGLFDSALIFTKRSLDTAIRYNYKDNVVGGANLLQKVYAAQGNEHQAYVSSLLGKKITDSMLSVNNINQLLALTFNEEVREKDAAAKEKENQEQRIRHIESLLIAIILITLATGYLIIARKIRTKPKVIVYIGSIGLLIMFEFINLLVHPLVETYTNHSTPGMLLVLVLIAAILIPIHHRLERFVEAHIEKNHQRSSGA